MHLLRLLPRRGVCRCPHVPAGSARACVWQNPEPEGGGPGRSVTRFVCGGLTPHMFCCSVPSAHRARQHLPGTCPACCCGQASEMCAMYVISIPSRTLCAAARAPRAGSRVVQSGLHQPGEYLPLGSSALRLGRALRGSHCTRAWPPSVKIQRAPALAPSTRRTLAHNPTLLQDLDAWSSLESYATGSGAI